MRSIGVIFVISLIVCGCAGNPTVPSIDDGSSEDLSVAGMTSQAGNHRLWGEWQILIDADHTHAEAIPIRSGRFHLNTIKFLEEYCTDCLDIESIKNNGDGTIDLTVGITHPFAGYPEYTGFDVKGIIMFHGSYSLEQTHPLIPLPNPFYLSWRLMGDPEVLNADGYTPRWSPNWDSGSNMPIFNYREGKYTRGVPDADLNAYLDYYSLEERHIFQTYSHVQRTYRIWLPPGEPIVAGYAVEACWEPPLRTPVTNPVEDFPLTANQPEPYYFQYVVNNGEDITDCEAWGDGEGDCEKMYMEFCQWGGLISTIYRRFRPTGGFYGWGFWDCDPAVENRSATAEMAACEYGNGTFRSVCLVFWFDGYFNDIAYTVFDWTVNDPNIGG